MGNKILVTGASGNIGSALVNELKAAGADFAVMTSKPGATIAGVETNAMQFYPDASLVEEAVHPGLYRRRAGGLDLSTIGGPGFGYRLAEIRRELPESAARHRC